MELNFDKEMDALLRQAARQETAAPAAEVHLDVDELAAFSANALPVKARARAMEHLVDCGNCRTILSNLVFFENQEEEKPAASFAIAAPVVKESSLLERILGVFKFPTLAYGMAGLVLLFTAAIGFMVFRSNSGGAEMAQVSNKDLSVATKAVSEQLKDTSNQSFTAANSNMAVDAPQIASAANTAVGGAFSVPQSIPVGGTFAANSTSNMVPLRKDNAGPGTLEEQPKVRSAPLTTIDGISADDAAPPPPAAARPDDAFRSAKPQQNTLNDQVTRGQDNNLRMNSNVQNVMTPDGNDKDRRQRAVTGEAGATLSREAATRDEKEKLDLKDAKSETKIMAPAKTEPKKAGKKDKKKAAAAAEASATPAPTPAKTPEPKKTPQKPDDEERPPCR